MYVPIVDAIILSLNSFVPGDGYWLIANEPFVFEYIDPQGASLARGNELPIVPEEFSYYQSIYQSFYFAKDINLTNSQIENGDWIVAYNNETIVVIISLTKTLNKMRKKDLPLMEA